MMNSAPTRLRLKITSDPANLAGTRRSIEMLCAENGFEQRVCDEVGLCVNEALANVMRHAYGGATDRPIEVGAEARNEAVRVTIRDWGNGVDPQLRLREHHDPCTPGGLGLLCLKRMMTDVRFTPQPDGMLLEMTRKK